MDCFAALAMTAKGGAGASFRGLRQGGGGSADVDLAGDELGQEKVALGAEVGVLTGQSLTPA